MFDNKQFERTFTVTKQTTQNYLNICEITDPFFTSQRDVSGRYNIDPLVKVLVHSSVLKPKIKDNIVIRRKYIHSKKLGTGCTFGHGGWVQQLRIKLTEDGRRTERYWKFKVDKWCSRPSLITVFPIGFVFFKRQPEQVARDNEVPGEFTPALIS